MPDDLTVDTVETALADVTHPEIDASLPELGMIDDVTIDGETVFVDIALPMAGIPQLIQQLLEQLVVDRIADLGASAEVSFVVMDDQTKERFFELEEQQWAGLGDDESSPDQSPPL